MWTYVADRVIDAAPSTVEGAASAVVRQVWGERAIVVAESNETGRMYAIGDPEAGAEVWLTVRVLPADQGARLTLVLDEVESGPDPAEGLDQILDLVGELAATGAA